MVEHYLNLYDHFSIHEQLLRSVQCSAKWWVLMYLAEDVVSMICP